MMAKFLESDGVCIKLISIMQTKICCLDNHAQISPYVLSKTSQLPSYSVPIDFHL